MKTMLLADGDLVVGTSSDYQMVTDARKVQQDLKGALLEPLGNDRFHPGWGSGLHDMIGLPATPLLRSNVLGEVNRVIGNYAAVQRDMVEADVLSGQDTRYSTDEIVASVEQVDVTTSTDSVRIRVAVSTVAQSQVEIVGVAV